MEPQNPDPNANLNPSPAPGAQPGQPPMSPAPSVPSTPVMPEQTPQPAPEQVPGVPAPEPAPGVVPPQQAMPQPMQPQSSRGSKKRLIVGLSIIGAALVLLGVGAYFAMKMLGGIKLEAYKDDNFSMMVPVDYTTEDLGDGVSFTEKGDKKTSSAVAANVTPYPAEATDEQIDEYIEQFKETMQDNVKETDEGGVVKNIVVTEVTHNGNKALKLTADHEIEGVTEKGFIVAGFTKNELYVIAITVDPTDPGLLKKVDTILDSFKLQ